MFPCHICHYALNPASRPSATTPTMHMSLAGPGIAFPGFFDAFWNAISSVFLVFSALFPVSAPFAHGARLPLLRLQRRLCRVVGRLLPQLLAVLPHWQRQLPSCGMQNTCFGSRSGMLYQQYSRTFPDFRVRGKRECTAKSIAAPASGWVHMCVQLAFATSGSGPACLRAVEREGHASPQSGCAIEALSMTELARCRSSCAAHQRGWHSGATMVAVMVTWKLHTLSSLSSFSLHMQPIRSLSLHTCAHACCERRESKSSDV